MMSPWWRTGSAIVMFRGRRRGYWCRCVGSTLLVFLWGELVVLGKDALADVIGEWVDRAGRAGRCICYDCGE